VEHEGDFRVEPVLILDWKVKVVNKKSIELVKVQWTCYDPKDVIWEHEENMWEEYPQLFYNFEENIMQDSILNNYSSGATSQIPSQPMLRSLIK